MKMQLGMFRSNDMEFPLENLKVLRTQRYGKQSGHISPLRRSTMNGPTGSKTLARPSMMSEKEMGS